MTINSDSQSMTGYAVVEANGPLKKYRLHMKSVNNRFFELKWRAPKNWISLELEFRSTTKDKFRRGSFDFWVEEIKDQSASAGPSAHSYFSKLNEALKTIKGINRMQLPSFIQAMILARQPELWFRETEESFDLDLEGINEALQKLLTDLYASRMAEGMKILDQLLQHCVYIESRFLILKKQLPALKKEHEHDLKAKLKELFARFEVGESERSKIASEVAVMTEKKDCSEELQRIEAHLENFQNSVKSGQNNLGKRPDFIAQELNREWTTLGSKVRNKSVFDEVLNAKLEVEKIREQCLNLA